MSNSGKAGNGRGNNRKRHRRRTGEGEWPPNSPSFRNDRSDRNDAQGRGAFPKRGGEVNRDERVSFVERPRWVPPKPHIEPLPVSTCPWCGKPIRDLSSAIADKDTGVPVHFDCVTSRIAFGEKLEKGESVVYIGGGRFGIVYFGGPPYSQNRSEHRDFTIKKIIEWENKEKRAEWRSIISDHFSET